MLKRQKKLYLKSKKQVVQGLEGSAKIGKKVVQRSDFGVKIFAPTKETITKENIQKKIYNRKYDKFFELFWDAFDDKRGKKPAYEKSWRMIPDLDEKLCLKIIEGAKRYAAERKNILARNGTPKMAQGWLKDRRWEDEIKQGEFVEGFGFVPRWDQNPDLENK